MLRPITLTSGLLAAALLAAGAGLAQAEPRLVYTRHTLKLDLRDLDLSRDAGRRALRARISAAADEVCGGRPDRGNRYTSEDLKRMLPAYDKCRAEAVQRIQASLDGPAMLARNTER